MEKIINNYKSLLSNLENLKSLSIDNLDLNKTGLFIVDMNNGFAKEGALSSPRVEEIIEPIADFGKVISSKINTIVAFTDTHDEDAVEFKSYPTHCLRGDMESETVKELGIEVFSDEQNASSASRQGRQASCTGWVPWAGVRS